MVKASGLPALARVLEAVQGSRKLLEAEGKVFLPQELRKAKQPLLAL